MSIIGISLACLVTSACAIDKTPEEESISHYPGETAGLPQGNGETPTGESPGSAEGLITMVGSPTATSELAEKPFAGFEPAAASLRLAQGTFRPVTEQLAAIVLCTSASALRAFTASVT